MNCFSFAQDSDVTQEIVLKHHASVSELKRIFMEDMPVYGPTEWDRRLSSYTPAIFPKLSNGEILNGIDRVSFTAQKKLDHITVWNWWSYLSKAEQGFVSHPSLTDDFIFQMGADGLSAM